VHEVGTHAVRRSPAEVAGDHHIESRGPSDRSGPIGLVSPSATEAVSVQTPSQGGTDTLALSSTVPLSIGESEIPFASVNGQRLYFENTAGAGPVVVFSHGNLMNSEMWAPQVDAIDQLPQRSDYRFKNLQSRRPVPRRERRRGGWMGRPRRGAPIYSWARWRSYRRPTVG
jgi:hypothetical protein